MLTSGGSAQAVWVLGAQGSQDGTEPLSRASRQLWRAPPPRPQGLPPRHPFSRPPTSWAPLPPPAQDMCCLCGSWAQ